MQRQWKPAHTEQEYTCDGFRLVKTFKQKTTNAAKECKAGLLKAA